MNRWFRLLFILTLFALGTYVLSAKAALSPEAGQYLQNQSVIRVWISPAPGFGHQAATVTVMKRLRQLGYRGQFEVVYDPTIAKKLETLLPGFDSKIEGWQDLKELGMRTIELRAFRRTSESSELAFGLTGADDNLKVMKPEVLKVQKYLRLQPLGWGSSSLLENGKPAQLLKNQNNLGYFYEVDSSREAIDLNLKQLSETDHFAKTEGLRAILTSSTIEIGSIYGVGLIPDMAGRLRFWVEAIQTAQRSTNADFRGGAVLPIISGLNDVELRTLAFELSTLKKKVQVVKVEDPLLPEMIRNLKKTDVLVVHTGRVTQNVFETLFKNSRLPLLLAGKNAMNLARLLERPYLNTVGDYKFTGDVDAKVKTLVTEAAQGFHYSSAAAITRQRTARFILEAMNPDSKLVEFYESLGLQGRDKVAEAIEEISGANYRMKTLSCQGAFSL